MQHNFECNETRVCKVEIKIAHDSKDDQASQTSYFHTPCISTNMFCHVVTALKSVFSKILYIAKEINNLNNNFSNILQSFSNGHNKTIFVPCNFLNTR